MNRLFLVPGVLLIFVCYALYLGFTDGGKSPEFVEKLKDTVHESLYTKEHPLKRTDKKSKASNETKSEVPKKTVDDGKDGETEKKKDADAQSENKESNDEEE